MRVLVTGAGALLAAAVAREFAAAGTVIALGHAELDVANQTAVRNAIAGARPDAVINCAAYNDVDGAEEAADRALAVNALAVRTLARAARDASIPLVHYGTDFVFDGTATTPYREEDPPNPRGAYASSKLLGDWFALEYPRSYVLRVESLFGEPAPGHAARGSLGRIVAGIRAGETLKLFADRVVSPAYTTDIATATRLLLERNAAPGLYHCVNAGSATWIEIASEAARLLDRPLHYTPITLETAQLRAARPKRSPLAIDRLRAAGVEMPGWRDALGRHLRAEH